MSSFRDMSVLRFHIWAKSGKFVKKRRVLKCFPDIGLWKSSLVSMCSPRQARLNALRGFFHTQFILEILAKYCENPSCLSHKLFQIWRICLRLRSNTQNIGSYAIQDKLEHWKICLRVLIKSRLHKAQTYRLLKCSILY